MKATTKSFVMPHGNKQQVQEHPEMYGANGVLRYSYWTQEQKAEYKEYRKSLTSNAKAANEELLNKLEEVCKDIPEALDLIKQIREGSSKTTSNLTRWFGTEEPAKGSKYTFHTTDPSDLIRIFSAVKRINEKGQVKLLIKDNAIVVD